MRSWLGTSLAVVAGHSVATPAAHRAIGSAGRGSGLRRRMRHFGVLPGRSRPGTFRPDSLWQACSRPAAGLARGLLHGTPQLTGGQRNRG